MWDTYPINEDASSLWFRLQDSVMEFSVILMILGAEGGAGKLLGSGILWNIGDVLFFTVRDADHDVSPLSEDAVQV